MGKQQMKFILDAIVFFLLFINIICLGTLIAEHQKITICQSCQEQNWTGEITGPDMRINCSEVQGWCEEIQASTRNTSQKVLCIWCIHIYW